MAKIHQIKVIDSALSDAVGEGFTYEKPSGGASHAAGTLRCPKKNAAGCKNSHCHMFVRSMPAKEDKAAKNIRRWVKKCGVQVQKARKEQERLKALKDQRQKAKAEKSEEEKS